MCPATGLSSWLLLEAPGGDVPCSHPALELAWLSRCRFGQNVLSGTFGAVSEQVLVVPGWHRRALLFTQAGSSPGRKPTSKGCIPVRQRGREPGPGLVVPVLPRGSGHAGLALPRDGRCTPSPLGRDGSSTPSPHGRGWPLHAFPAQPGLLLPPCPSPAVHAFLGSSGCAKGFALGSRKRCPTLLWCWRQKGGAAFCPPNQQITPDNRC